MRRPAPRSERLRRLAVGHATFLPVIWVAGATQTVTLVPLVLATAVLAFLATGPFQADLVFNPNLDGGSLGRWRLGFWTAFAFAWPVFLLYWWIHVRPRA